MHSLLRSCRAGILALYSVAYSSELAFEGEGYEQLLHNKQTLFSLILTIENSDVFY